MFKWRSSSKIKIIIEKKNYIYECPKVKAQVKSIVLLCNTYSKDSAVIKTLFIAYITFSTVFYSQFSINIFCILIVNFFLRNLAYKNTACLAKSKLFILYPL